MSNAQIIDFLLSEVLNASGPLAGGRVYPCEPGTLTPKTVWTDRDKTAPVVTPYYTLDANGTAQLYGDGVYRFILKTAAGATVYDRDNIPIKGADWVDVRDYGAKSGDDVTLETTNTAAFNAASVAAAARGIMSIHVPAGCWRLNGEWDLPDYMHVEGVTLQTGAGGAVNGTDIRFNMNSGVAIRSGVAPHLERLKITCIGSNATYTDVTFSYGTAIANGLQVTGNATIRDCQFYNWHHAVVFGASSYYFKSFNVEFNRCNYGYFAGDGSPYNVHIDSPRSALTNVFITGGTGSTPINNIKIIGGSIEGFKTIAQYYNSISVFGTYIETANNVDTIYAFAPAVNYSSTALYGTLTYLNHITRLVDTNALPGASITSSGNELRGYDDSAAGCTVFFLSSTGIRSISLTGDTFGTVAAVQDTVHYTNVLSTFMYGIISYPSVPSTNDNANLSGRVLFGAVGGFGINSSLAAAPSTTALASGSVFLANGGSWDPLTLGAGRPYYVVWQGDRWYSLSGLSKTMDLALFFSTAWADNGGAGNSKIQHGGSGHTIDFLTNSLSRMTVTDNGVKITGGYLGLSTGGAVSSATTIAPTGNIFHVTGTTAVATISLPYTGFTGTVRIVPDGIFTTTTAGNIGLASVAVVGKVLEMTYDGTKWYPSY